MPTMIDPLEDLSIEERNHIIDRIQAEIDSIEAEMDRRAELAAERYWEEGPHGGWYAGSLEESRDRYLDSLIGR